MKRIIVKIIICILTVSLVACNNSNTTDVTEQASAKTPEEETIVHNKNSAEEKMQVVSFCATEQSIYKFYEDGTIGYYGDNYNYQTFLNNNILGVAFYEALIKANIPIVAEHYEVEWLKEQYPEHEILEKGYYDKAAYQQQYGSQIDEIKSSILYEEHDEIALRQIEEFKSWEKVYLYDLASKKGIVSYRLVVHLYNDVDNDYIVKTKVNAFSDETIVKVTIGEYFVAALTDDGHVLVDFIEEAIGNMNRDDNVYERFDTSKWKDIVDIEAGDKHLLGIKNDGTVVAVGDNSFNQLDVSKWKNIVSIEAGGNHSVGLLKNGSVLACGNNDLSQCEVGEWTDITQISASNDISAALNKKGEVFITGGEHATVFNEEDFSYETKKSNFVWQPNAWTNVDHVFVYENTVIGLTANNELVFTNVFTSPFHNADWQHGVRDIISDGAGYSILKDEYILAYTSTDKITQDINATWDSFLLKNIDFDPTEVLNIDNTYTPEHLTQIDDEGALVVAKYNHEIEDYDIVTLHEFSKIIDYDVLKIRFIYAISDDGSLIEIDLSSLDVNNVTIDSSTLKEPTIDVDLFSNMIKAGNTFVILQKDGTVMLPSSIETGLGSDIRTFGSKSVNWSGLKDDEAETQNTNSEITYETKEVESWEAFNLAFDNMMPDYKQFNPYYFTAYRHGEQEFIYRAEFSNNVSEETYETMQEMAINSGYELVQELESYYILLDQDGNENQMPMPIKTYLNAEGYSFDMTYTPFDDSGSLELTFIESYKKSPTIRSNLDYETPQVSSWEDFSRYCVTPLPDLSEYMWAFQVTFNEAPPFPFDSWGLNADSYSTVSEDDFEEITDKLEQAGYSIIADDIIEFTYFVQQRTFRLEEQDVIGPVDYIFLQFSRPPGYEHIRMSFDLNAEEFYK